MAKDDQNTQFSGTAYEGILNNLPTDQSAGSETTGSPYANIDLSTTEKKEPKASVEIGPAIIDQLAPAGAGAVMGTALSKYGTKPYELTPAFQEATSVMSDADIKQNAIQKELDRINQLHISNLDQLQSVHEDHTNKLQTLKQKLDEARHRAEMIDALDFGERKVPGASATYNYTAVMPGDEIPHKMILEAKDMTTGQHGTGAGDIAEKNRLLAEKTKALGLQEYRLSGKLDSQLFVPPQKGVTPTEQRLAKAAYELAKAEHDTHLSITQEIANKIDKLKASTPIEKTRLAAKLLEADIFKLQAMEKLKQLTPSPGKIGQVLNRIPGVEPTLGALNAANQWVNRTPVVKHLLPAAGGALSSMQTVEGLEDWKKGQKLKGGLEMLSGLGGMVGTIPHPYARGIGLASQVPYLGYEGYEYLSDKLKNKKP